MTPALESTAMESIVLDSPVSDNPAPLAARVGPVEGLRQTFSLAWRTLVQIKHNPAEVIDFSVQPLMFLLLFTYVFGGAIGARRRRTCCSRCRASSCRTRCSPR